MLCRSALIGDWGSTINSLSGHLSEPGENSCLPLCVAGGAKKEGGLPAGI